MTLSKANDWSEGLHPTAAEFLKSAAKKVAKLVANAENMGHFRARIDEFAKKWTKFKTAEQADQEGNWQPSMGIHDNPLGAIWPDIYIQQPGGHGIHLPVGPRDVPEMLGDYALLQAIQDHVLSNCERIDATGVLREPSDEIWQNVVTFVEGESGSAGYVNTGLIDRAMKKVAADLETRRMSTTSTAATDEGGERQRDLDAFVVSAGAKARTKSFMKWVGGERVTLAVVFTDVVASTALGEQIKDEAMNEVRRAHFAQSRKLIGQFQGREIKTIGDSFMAAFKSVEYALDYALALHGHTGHPQVRIRAGIHIGPMQVEEDDVFGGTVNFAARVVGVIKDDEIWVSTRAKEDIDQLGASRHRQLKWERHDEVPMKGFPSTFTLWSLRC